MSIPDSDFELCDRCFKGCKSLCRVTFGSSSSLELIGIQCFEGCNLIEFEIPGTVGSIGGRVFCNCPLPRGVICRDGCRFCVFDGFILSRDCYRCFCSYGILSSVCIPDSVRELCDRCFGGCKNLRYVSFGSSSSVERIGAYCFKRSGVEEVDIPDSVCELCDGCFKGCKSLRCVTFGSSSSVERISAYCFAYSGVEEVIIPDGVRELCDGCFDECKSLCRVTFGSSSSVERIGAYCFAYSGVEEVIIPDSVRELCDNCFRNC